MANNGNNDKSLESWIWDAACSIRGAKDAPKYKEYILPLIFAKRLCDVFDDELNRIAKEVGSRAKAFKLVKHDKKLVRFSLPLEPKNPDDPVWSIIRKLADKIGEQLTTILRDIADENSLLKGIIDRVDFKATTHGVRDLDDDRLSNLIERISEKRSKHAEPMMNCLVETEIGRLPATWHVQRLGELFETQLGKILSQKAHVGNSPQPYLRNKNVQWGRIDVSDMLYMDFDDREKEKFRLRAGDLLVCEGGEPGRAAIWNGALTECFYQKALHRLRPRDGRIFPELLAEVLVRASESLWSCGREFNNRSSS
jgi:hypothetical protein